MFWELYQQSRINTANQKAGRAERAAERAAHRSDQMVVQLESKIDSLALTCRALFEILERHGAVTEAQLEQKMQEIDLRDGTEDGRITPRSKVCSECGRRVSSNRSMCLYCGGMCVEEG